jgi:hypothetical protein
MTVDYEPAPRPTPLWALPVTIAALALALLWVVHNYYSNPEVGGFGGRAQPSTPMPEALADGAALPEPPEPLTDLFGDNVVMTKRLAEVPDEVEKRCRQRYANDDGVARERLHELLESSAVTASHIGPDALTYLSIAVDEAPPGYPDEVTVACVARMDGQAWETPNSPYLDFALDGRPGARMTDPDLRTRLVQVPVGARWAVQPRGGWWLAYDVRETSWALMTLNDAITDGDPLRVTFVDSTGEVVADRPVGPTRSAASSDHSADFELVAGDVPVVLERISNSPIRICDPGNATLCVWLAFDERQDVIAYAGFGPHPLDTPPMGYVGYCPKADMLQGSLTSAQFNTDGTWAGGPGNRGLDRYTVRYEANKVVVDLSEHVRGDVADRDEDEVEAEATCEFDGAGKGNVIEEDDDDKKDEEDEDDDD